MNCVMKMKKLISGTRSLRARVRGLTVVEILVVLTIIAILVSSSVPSFASALERYRTNGVAVDLQHALMQARTQALATGDRVVVAPLTINNWVEGWRIYQDPNNNGVFDAGERVLQVFEARNAEVTIVLSERLFEGGEGQVSFTQFGFPRARNGTTFADGSVTVQLGATTRIVCLDAQGRTRVIHSGAC